MNLQHIRNLIGDGETANAVKALLNLLQEGAGKNKRLRDDLLIISNQLQELKRKDTMGVLDTDEVRHQYAQLNSALLALIEEMETVNPDAPNITQRQEPVSSEPVSASQQKRRLWWWLLLPLLAVGGALGIFRNQLFNPEGNTPAPIPPKVAPDATAVQPPPLARFTFENAMCKAPCEVRFKNESRYADGYRWDFGDGTRSTDEQPKHIYRAAGQYTVVLVALKDQKQDTSFQNLQIAGAAKMASPPPPAPKAGFQFATPGEAPCNVLFANTSTHATRYQWTVNGTLAGTGSSLDYRFEQPGLYEVRLVAMSANGRDAYAATVQINRHIEPLLVVDFTVDKKVCETPCQVQCINRSANADRYEWRVNGQLRSSDKDFAQNFSSADNYIIQLTGYQGNASKKAEHSVLISKPPDFNVGFIANKTTCEAPCQIEFINRSSSNADRFEWRVNGQLRSRNKGFTQTFTTPGAYTVQLTGYRGDVSKNAESSVRIGPPIIVRDFTVAFIPNKTTCDAPCQIAFDNRSSSDVDRFEWRVNGQLRSRNKEFAQTFPTPGTYTIQLTGYRGDASKNAESSVRIIMSSPELKVAFTPTKTTCEAPCQILFSNGSANADRYEWRVDGQLRSKAKDYMHSFSTKGDYVVQLTGYQGTTDKSIERTIRITTPLPRESNAPIPLSPAPGAIFNIFPRATTLRWQSVNQAASYSVELDCMGCCASGRWCTDVGRTYQIKDGLMETTYNFNWVGAQKGRWRVWAKLRDGTLTGKSVWREFDYRR